MRLRLVEFLLGFALGVAVMVWLGLWADDRNQRFYIANERRPDWAGASHWMCLG